MEYGAFWCSKRKAAHAGECDEQCGVRRSRLSDRPDMSGIAMGLDWGGPVSIPPRILVPQFKCNSCGDSRLRLEPPPAGSKAGSPWNLVACPDCATPKSITASPGVLPVGMRGIFQSQTPPADDDDSGDD